MTYHKKLTIAFMLAIVGLTACEKKVDPFVDRVVAPVLVIIDNATGDGGGLTQEPVVSQKVTGPVTLSVRIYELDKAGTLDNKVGIDSIPVSSLTLKLAGSLVSRPGTAIGTLTTDATGKATISKTWAELGIAAPKAGSSVLLTWTGEYKGQAFSRYSRLQGIN